MDRFFNGAFLTFGLEVIAFAERDQVSQPSEGSGAAIYQIVCNSVTFYPEKNRL